MIFHSHRVIQHSPGAVHLVTKRLAVQRQANAVRPLGKQVFDVADIGIICAEQHFLHELVALFCLFTKAARRHFKRISVGVVLRDGGILIQAAGKKPEPLLDEHIQFFPAVLCCRDIAE